MNKATDKETSNVYAFRNHCIKALTKKLKGKEIFKYSAYDKKSLGVDFRIDGVKVKYKCVKHKQIYLMFEIKNGPNDGWFAAYKDGIYKSVATELYYHIDEENIVYVVDIMRVREYIKNPLNNIKITEKGMYGGGSAYLVSIEDMMKNNIIKKIINL